MTRILVLMVVLMGCGDSSPIGPDAGLDAGMVDAAIAPSGDSLHVPIGATCNIASSYWCAEYDGVCAMATCRAQCSGIHTPRCTAGTHEQHADLGRGMQCWCEPD